MMKNASCNLVTVLVLVLVGCQQNPPVAEKPTTIPEAVDPQTQSAYQLVLASWEETEKRIAAHRGKVVVVDFWSTWCGPCVEEFPNLVKLHQQHSGQVACLSVNCNYNGAAEEPVENAKPEVDTFLRKQQADFENVLCTDADEQLFTKLNAASIPIVRVYDKEGKLVKQFVNDDNEYGEKGFTYTQHIVPLVEKLISGDSAD